MSKKQPNGLLSLFKIGAKDGNFSEKEPVKNPKELFKSGIEHFKEKNIDKAQEEFTKLLKMEPGNLEVQLYLAKICIFKGEYNQAITLLKQYLNEEPNSFEAKLRLSTAYIKVKEFELAIGILNQLKNTQSDTKQTEKVNATLAKAYYSQATFFKDSKKYKEALACYEQGAKFENNEEKKLFHIALCYKEMQKYSKAIEFLNNALTANEKPEDNKYTFDIYYQLGDLEERQGNTGSAIRIYHKFIETSLIHKDNYFFKAKINFLQKDYDKAIENFLEALKTEKYKAQVYIELAKAYSIQKRDEEALSIYKELLKIEKDNVSVLLNIAITRIRLGDIGKAFDILNKVDESSLEQYPEIIKYLGKTLLELNMFDEAIQKLNLAKKLWPDDAEIVIYLAQCFKKSGDKESYDREFQRALKMSPNNFIVLKELAQSHKENLNFEKAIEVYKKILSLDSREKEPLKLIADLHMENKDLKEAVKNYREYLTFFKNDADAIYNLASCYFEMIEMTHAAEELEKLQDNAKYGFEASSLLSNIYISKGDMNKALVSVQKSIEYSPNYIDGYLKYGKVCAYVGQISRALTYLNYAENLDPNNKEIAYLIKYYSDKSDHIA